MDIVCLPGETRLDDFNISEDCESDQVYFGVRLTTLIIHALLLIACVAHHIRFRRSVSILFKPNQWEHVHASTIMIFFLMVYGNLYIDCCVYSLFCWIEKKERFFQRKFSCECFFQF